MHLFILRDKHEWSHHRASNLAILHHLLSCLNRHGRQVWHVIVLASTSAWVLTRTQALFTHRVVLHTVIHTVVALLELLTWLLGYAMLLVLHRLRLLDHLVDVLYICIVEKDRVDVPRVHVIHVILIWHSRRYIGHQVLSIQVVVLGVYVLLLHLAGARTEDIGVVNRLAEQTWRQIVCRNLRLVMTMMLGLVVTSVTHLILSVANAYVL